MARKGEANPAKKKNQNIPKKATHNHRTQKAQHESTPPREYMPEEMQTDILSIRDKYFTLETFPPRKEGKVIVHVLPVDPKKKDLPWCIHCRDTSTFDTLLKSFHNNHDASKNFRFYYIGPPDVKADSPISVTPKDPKYDYTIAVEARDE